MIKIEQMEVMGWEPAIRGMRNPMNSWDESDTIFELVGKAYSERWTVEAHPGPKDLALMQKLCRGGADDRKFMRMIICYCDITAPLYWWKEFDTYRIGVEKNSCSTMHKIAAKEFTLDDFSHEHLTNKYDDKTWLGTGFAEFADGIVDMLNTARKMYLELRDKNWWWQMIQLLPSSYNQKRTVMMSYEALTNMYHARRHHRLDEWREFCHWIETLPMAELITGGGKDGDA